MAKQRTKAPLWTWGEFKAYVDNLVPDQMTMDVAWGMVEGQEAHTGLPKKRSKQTGPEENWEIYLQTRGHLLDAQGRAKVERLRDQQQKRWAKQNAKAAEDKYQPQPFDP